MGTLITLKCGHAARFSPPPGHNDMVLCRSCDDYSTVAPVSQWTVRCLGCTLGRNLGADEHEARRMGRRHLIKYPVHVVILTNGNNTEEMRSGDESLPDYLQWHQSNPEHVGSLRSLRTEIKP